MDPKNDRFRAFLGVDKWHEAGYTGSRVTAGSAESFMGKTDEEHARLTYLAFKEIAPGARAEYVGISGIVNEGRIAEFTGAVRDKGISCWFASISPASAHFSLGSESALRKASERCAFFAAAGNYEGRKYNPLLDSLYIYGVASHRLMADGRAVPEPESSVSAHVDFTAPHMLHIGARGPFAGTSCAAPVLCGMAALVNDFFIKRTGRPLPGGAMYRFLKDNSTDMRDAGPDSKTGWGYVTLPPPQSIDIWRYTMAKYNDDASIAPWAREAVYSLTEKGVITGDGKGNFNPAAPATRQEIAVMLDRQLEYIKANF